MKHMETDTPAAPEADIEALLQGVREGDSEATATLLRKYGNTVRSVAFDVLQDMPLATLCARDVMSEMVRLLRKGVRTGEFEPWLMWLSRDMALKYTQMSAGAVTAQKPGTTEKTPAAPKAVVFPEHMQSASQAQAGDPFSFIEKAARPAETEGFTFEEKAAYTPSAPSNPFTDFSDELRAEKDIPRPGGIADSQSGAESALRDDGVDDEEPEGRRSIQILLIVLVVLLGLVMVWFAVGIVSRFAAGIPDLGYSWFNTNVLPVF